jgi:hypothetical protein
VCVRGVSFATAVSSDRNAVLDVLDRPFFASENFSTVDSNDNALTKNYVSTVEPVQQLSRWVNSTSGTSGEHIANAFRPC